MTLMTTSALVIMHFLPYCTKVLRIYLPNDIHKTNKEIFWTIFEERHKLHGACECTIENVFYFDKSNLF